MNADAVATVTPPDGLNLRAAPGTQYPTLDLVPGGTRIALTGDLTDGSWYPAVYKGKRGFLRAEFLDLPGDATMFTRRATVRRAEGASLYDEPHAAAQRLATLTVGTSVTVSARTTSDGWVLTAHAGATGWLDADHLQIDGAPVAPAVAVAAVGMPARATITYYHHSLEGGAMACGGRYRGEDATIAAATSWPCGTRLRVCRNSTCITVTVQDSGSLGPNWVDLSAAAFRQLAPLSDMLITGTVEPLPP